MVKLTFKNKQGMGLIILNHPVAKRTKRKRPGTKQKMVR
jgi:hypothetical protein